MALLIALTGLAAGWLFNPLSDHLPLRPRLIAPALWQVAKHHDARSHSAAAVEAACALGALALALRFDLSWTLAAGLALFFFLALITLIDWKHRIIPNALIYPALLIVLAARVVLAPGTLGMALLGGFFAFFIFYGSAVIGRGGLGGGDIKLAALIGLLFGFPGILWALIFSAAATALYITALLIAGRARRGLTFAYGPFLCLGAMLAFFVTPPV